MVLKSVSVIGVGAIGAPIARRVLGAGFDLTVCDLDEAGLAAFAKLGVRVTRKPRDCAASDLVLVLVATAQQMRSVITGEHGIAAGLRAGASPLIVVMSTVGPGPMIDLARSVEPLGSRLLDAPVSGGVLRAEEGKLAILVGGDAADLAAARPVLDSLGDRLFHCGALGAAQTVKIVNNTIAAANVLVVAEAFRLALDQGIALNDVTPVLEASSGRNYLSERPGEAAASFAAWTRTRQDFAALTSILHKDLGVARGLAAASSTPAPFIESLTAFMGSLGDDTYATWRIVGSATAGQPKPGRAATSNTTEEKTR